jgi:alanine racemase
LQGLASQPKAFDDSTGALGGFAEIDMRASIRPTIAEIDLGAVQRNLGRLRQAVGPAAQVFGVVKADAYGHGAVPVARALEPLCEALAVSLVEEGFELRAAGIRAPILVLGAYYNRHQDDVLGEGLTPVVYDRGELERFAEAAKRLNRRVDVHVKVDTGMSRLGVAPADLAATLRRATELPQVRVAGLCTHFASADVADPAATEAALASFESSVATARRLGFTDLVLHAANSAAAVRFPAARLDAVRPGLALYGAMPSEVVRLPALEPALALRTRVMAVREIAPGTGVSYGGTWRAPRQSRVATLPIGYADGYPRHVREASVLLAGRRVPIVGVVCMDMLMIDVTDLPEAALEGPVTLIGRDGGDQIGVDDVARWAGTINYEILCGISKRVPRVSRDAIASGPSRAPFAVTP